MFSQIVEELLSGGSDSRGVTITGTPGSGKTTIMLQIVGRSCYGERVASAVCYLYQADNAGTCSDAERVASAVESIGLCVVSYYLQ